MKKDTPNSKQSPASKTRRPIIRGRNTPKNVHKAFRSHGNHSIVASAIDYDHNGHGYVSALA